MAEESTTGAIALGFVAAGVGIFAINYATSDPGKSWFDQIRNRLAAKSEEPHVLPPGKAQADSRPLPPRTIPTKPSAPGGPSRAQRAPVARPAGHAHAAKPPKMISPEMVKETASQLNAVFGTKLRTDGIITVEIQRAIKTAQQQLGLPQTGYPDWRLLLQLGKMMQDAAKVPVTADATNIISKTFGGPPSTAKTGPDEGVKKTQEMLNAYFKGHVLDVDGFIGPQTTGAIKEFQKAEKLQDTGTMDSATHDFLVKLTTDEPVQGDAGSLFSHRTGVLAGGDWKSEAQSLPQFSQDVLGKVIGSETNAHVLQGLGKVLNAAGYPKTAAAVLAKAGGAGPGTPAPTATSGYYPDPYDGFYPLTYGPYGQW